MSPGSGLVLPLHKMGEHDGHLGSWAFHQGGNGGCTQVLARAAAAYAPRSAPAPGCRRSSPPRARREPVPHAHRRLLPVRIGHPPRRLRHRVARQARQPADLSGPAEVSRRVVELVETTSRGSSLSRPAPLHLRTAAGVASDLRQRAPQFWVPTSNHTAGIAEVQPCRPTWPGPPRCSLGLVKVEPPCGRHDAVGPAIRSGPASTVERRAMSHLLARLWLILSCSRWCSRSPRRRSNYPPAASSCHT
jgi:hypothetical protein